MCVIYYVYMYIIPDEACLQLEHDNHNNNNNNSSSSSNDSNTSNNSNTNVCV